MNNMNYKMVFLILSLSSLLISFKSGGPTVTEKPIFKLNLTPWDYAKSRKDTAQIFLHNPETSHFNVLLSNISNDTFEIYDEWNSFGYFNLTFEIVYPDGKIVTSCKHSSGWDFNGPTSSSIPPGGHYIFEVSFDNDSTKGNEWWYNSIRNKPGKTTCCKIKAIYQNELNDEFNNKHAIWTGKVESAMTDYIVHLDNKGWVNVGYNKI